MVADHVVNTVNGKDRPVFSFNAPTSELPKITLLRSDLFVDVDPDRRPLESRISTGVYLRNQNQVPTASFSVASGGTGTRRFLLNGSGSTDPEGRTLSYSWFSGANPDLADTTCSSTDALGCIGRGVTLDYTFPASAGNGTQTFTLLVRDPGGLTATSKWTCNPTNGACSPVMIRSIVNNLRREEGWVVVTAVIVMGLMMGIGLATYATVDTQQAQSRVERERDSSFNLGESALYAEAFVLGRDWPTAANQYPAAVHGDHRGSDTRVPDAE